MPRVPEFIVSSWQSLILTIRRTFHEDSSSDFAIFHSLIFESNLMAPYREIHTVVGYGDLTLKALQGLILDEEHVSENYVRNNWASFGDGLGISDYVIQEYSKQLQARTTTRTDVVRDLLKTWLESTGGDGNLWDVIEVVETRAESFCVGEQIRLAFQLPCRGAHTEMTWDEVSEMFQYKVVSVLKQESPDKPDGELMEMAKALSGEQLIEKMTKAMVADDNEFY